jgi:hypothetical protein
LVAAELNFHVTTGSLAQTRTTQYIPYSGLLNSAIIHWPNGCDGLVEAILNLKSVKILPYPAEGAVGTVVVAGVTYLPVGIAYNDTTQPFSLNLPVEKRDPLELVIINHDDTNSHTLGVTCLVEEKLTYAGP